MGFECIIVTTEMFLSLISQDIKKCCIIVGWKFPKQNYYQKLNFFGGEIILAKHVPWTIELGNLKIVS